MKWDKVILIMFDANYSVIRDDAKAWKKRYKIPDDLCFCFGSKDEIKGFNKLYVGSITGISDLNTKIIITAHGNSTSVGGQSAEKLANNLRLAGIKQAGLISIKSCEAGKGDFLKDLCANLGGILVGWFNGYTNTASRTFGAHEGSGLVDGMIRMFTFGKLKLPDKWRIKVVKGNVNVTPPNGTSPRYPEQLIDIEDI